MQSFNELNLKSSLITAISELGFSAPTPIQAQTLPLLLADSTDFLGLAATGTGKTAAFSIPMLERLDPSVRAVQCLVLCPTRELAVQVAGQINLLGKHMGAKALPIYGGASYADQIHGLKRGVSVVVGTPGRVVDHINRGTLSLSQLTTVILDEADEMISMGFKEDLETVLNATPRESSNIWLFSATMSPEVRRVADEYLRDPATVQVNKSEMLPESIEQLYYLTHEANKPEVLCKLIDAADDFYGLIFCQTKSLVVDLTQYLKDRNYKVDCLHGDMDQNARDRVMASYRSRKISMLVCTDVASRGIDVKDITHVVNYSIPRELDSYVHRIGRTARSGKKGFAMSLVTNSHKGLIGRIEKMTKSRMKEGKIPTRKEIGARKVSRILSAFMAQESYVKSIELLDQAWHDTIRNMTPEEVTGRFLTLMYPETFGPNRDQSAETGVRAPARERQRGEDRGRVFNRDARENAGRSERSERRVFVPGAHGRKVDAAVGAPISPKVAPKVEVTAQGEKAVEKDSSTNHFVAALEDGSNLTLSSAGGLTLDAVSEKPVKASSAAQSPEKSTSEPYAPKAFIKKKDRKAPEGDFETRRFGERSFGKGSFGKGQREFGQDRGFKGGFGGKRREFDAGHGFKGGFGAGKKREFGGFSGSKGGFGGGKKREFGEHSGFKGDFSGGFGGGFKGGFGGGFKKEFGAGPKREFGSVGRSKSEKQPYGKPRPGQFARY